MSEISVSKLAIIAVIAGLLAAGGTMLFLSNVEAKYRKEAEPEAEQMIRVIVPRKNLSRGDRIERSMLASRSIPLKFAPANVLQAKDIEKVVDRTLLSNVSYGRPMTFEAITKLKAVSFSDVVEIGRRARSMRVTEVDSIDGLLRPGDRIDLMGTFQLSDLGYDAGQGNSGSSSSDESVLAVLENVEVLESARVDKNGRRYENKVDKNSKDGVDLNFTLLTLNLTPRQIARLELAEVTGSLFAVLRNPKDTGTVDFDYLSADMLLSKDEPAPESLVLGADGKPVGRIVGDQVVDADGNVIGKVIDGKPIGTDGKTLGSIATGISADDPIRRVDKVTDVVRDASGKVIGRIVNGKVLDRSGNVIGEIKDGKAVSSTGARLGNIAKNVALDVDGNEVNLQGSDAKQNIVVNSNGQAVGTIVGDQVLDDKGNVVGRIVDGKAVDLDGRALGGIRRNVSVSDPISKIAEVATVVRDNNGRVVGKVVGNSIVDANGNVVGRVDASGKAVANDGRSLGSIQSNVALDANGREIDMTRSVASKKASRSERVVRDANGAILGKVVDGKLVSPSGEVIGAVDASGKARDLSGRDLGSASKVMVNEKGVIVGVTGQVVRDAKGNVIGVVKNGQVVDSDGKVIGKVGADGKPVAIDGSSLGSVETAMIDGNGKVISSTQRVVRDAQGKIVGRVLDGKVIDPSGKVIGTVGADGKAVANDGSSLGNTDDVVIDAQGKIVAPSVSVVRNANGDVIGTLSNGKVIDASGNVVGTYQDGKVVSASGEVLAAGTFIGTASSSEVKQAFDQITNAAQVTGPPRIIDFIAGGTGKDGITPVVKVRLQ